MAIPELKSSICGLSIKAGALIIGYLSLGNSILSILNVLISVIIYSQNPNYTISEHSNFNGNFTESSAIDEQQTIQVMRDFTLALCIIMFIFSMTKLAIDVFLVVGVHKKNHCFMLPWIIVSGVGCALMLFVFALFVIGAFYKLILSIVNGNFDRFGIILVVAFLFTLAVSIGVYCYLIVYTHYRNVKNEKKIKSMDYSKM